jgi:hypothetical protein
VTPKSKNPATAKKATIGATKPPIRPVSPSSPTVQGKVADQAGTPRPGLAVKAFDRNVGVDDVLLGQAVTDAKGGYSISYTLKQLKGKPAPELSVGT